MNSAVQLEGVTHVYVGDGGASLAVENVMLDVAPGEFVSLIGPSGCGKTTILSLIAGLLEPTVGTVRIGGEVISEPTRKVGYMLQQDYLFPWRTIYENCLIGLELTGKITEQQQYYVLQLLEEMGLADAAHKYPHQLSGGMRQRVALVRTLATRPDILLLDEPFSALDYQTKLTLEDLVSETLKAHHKTAVLVTHDISEAIAMSDRVIVLQPSPGKIRKAVSVPATIRAATPFTARELAGFHDLFHVLWSEFEQMEQKGGREL
ncbi:ABC transporter ATP-binding protein [Paenibacillus thalictri]|uniref:ABC transporter ATP-binding protein n=1 Tax=Paenibacillus thalictri TaxID=2527873 RepID=A0A4Q9DTC7_9BACL|nr:ABC transporter ATP-binding protein [Paenibacillus thalictri]TBL80183.1 ABC transporter ATP-binding protein [Paenibacillus thalictri]